MAPWEWSTSVIEPVLGEGGYVPAPDEFMRGLRAPCSEHGILLVADEVQTECMGRDLLLLTGGTYGNVMRWIPPLVVDAAQIDAALDTFNEALAAAMN